jgi:hypothetical protein
VPVAVADGRITDSGVCHTAEHPGFTAGMAAGSLSVGEVIRNVINLQEFW